MPQRKYRAHSSEHDGDTHSESAWPGKSTLAGVLQRRHADPGVPLPGPLASRLGAATGSDLGDVKLHHGAASAQAAAALGAHAFTIGQDVHFGAERYQPDTPAGQHLIAHEVAHTVQQRGASPALQERLEVSSPGDAHEREAEAFASSFGLDDAAPVLQVTPASVSRLAIQRDAGPPPAAPPTDPESAGDHREVVDISLLDALPARILHQIDYNGKDEKIFRKCMTERAPHLEGPPAKEAAEAVTAADAAPAKGKGGKGKGGKKPRAIDPDRRYWQRVFFLLGMREVFGSDAATLAHYQSLVTSVFKSDVWMHPAAAMHAAKVKAEADQAGLEMPHSGGVGQDLRAFTGPGSGGHPHQLGYAVDFDAYNNPMITNQPSKDLIQLVTGRSHHVEVGKYGARRDTIGKLGSGALKETSPQAVAFFGQLDAETHALSEASKHFTDALRTKGKDGKVVDPTAELGRIRGLYFDAQEDGEATEEVRAARKRALSAELRQLFAPWLAMLGDKKATAGADLALETPTGMTALRDKELDKMAKDLGRATQALRPATHPGKADERRQGKARAQLVALDARLSGALGRPPVGADVTVAQVEGELAEARRVASGHKKADAASHEVRRIEGIERLLTEGSAQLFGKKRGSADEVKDPTIAQLLRRGFFKLPELFLKLMIKNGFDSGATWGSSDAMHFELVSALQPKPVPPEPMPEPKKG